MKQFYFKSNSIFIVNSSAYKVIEIGTKSKCSDCGDSACLISELIISRDIHIYCTRIINERRHYFIFKKL